MSSIAEIVSVDGEVISLTECASRIEFEYKVLNSLDFENIKSFFIKKTIIEAVREKHNLSNGSNGITSVDLINLFRWQDIESYLVELESKKIIKKRKGISLDMYFLPKKTK